MARINVTNREGQQSSVDTDSEYSVMEVLRHNGFDEVMALCGGCCSCGTCHVYVDPAWADRLPAISDDEDTMLDRSDHRRPESRLSCQLRFGPALDGLKLTIAPED